MFMPALSKNGNNGFHILVPLKTSDERYYIFDTGWIPLKLKEKSLRVKNIVNEVNSSRLLLERQEGRGIFNQIMT